MGVGWHGVYPIGKDMRACVCAVSFLVVRMNIALSTTSLYSSTPQMRPPVV